MSALNGHKFIIIGDSYTVGITGGGATIDSWLDYFVSWYGSEWAGYFESAEGGYGFAKPNNTFLSLLNALDNTISDKASITDILVAGGYNDHAYVSSLSSAIAEFKQTANTKYPNATLWIAPIGWTINEYQSEVSQAIEGYISWGNNYGFRVLEEMKYVMRNTSRISSDEIHPNESGYKALAENMHRYLVSYISAPRIRYNGADKWKVRATELLNEGSGGGGGLVDDVQVNGTSVVTNKVANIDLTPYAETSSLATVATSGSYNDLTNKPSIPTKTSDLTNDSNYVADASYVHTDNNFTTAEKTKLSGIASGAEENVQSDWSQSDSTADDYIKNKPTIPAAQVNSDWNASSGVAKILNKPTLATVATSGSYNDLSNKPTIPAAQVNSDWNASSGVARILNKPSLATVATSGSYNDLSNKPDLSTKVSKSGDTMTGDLLFDGKNVRIKSTEIDVDTTPSADANGRIIQFQDKDGAQLGFIRIMKDTSGVHGLQFVTTRNISGTTKYNILRLGLDDEGNVKINISGTGSASAWRTAMSAQAALSTSYTTTGTDGFNIRKYGKVVQIQGNGIAANKRGTVPSGYRPETSVHLPGIVFNGSQWYFGTIEITIAGAITIHYIDGTTNKTTTSSSYTIYVSGTYVQD